MASPGWSWLPREYGPARAGGRRPREAHASVASGERLGKPQDDLAIGREVQGLPERGVLRQDDDLDRSGAQSLDAETAVGTTPRAVQEATVRALHGHHSSRD